MTLNDSYSQFQVHTIFDTEYLRNCTRCRHSFNGILLETYIHGTQQCHLKMTLSDLAIYSLPWSIARPLCNSRASCRLVPFIRLKWLPVSFQMYDVHSMSYLFLYESTGWGKMKYPNTKIAISQKCLNIFAPNFAHLFGTILCTNVLLCAVFTWHMSNWQKRKLHERISQLNKKLILLLCK